MENPCERPVASITSIKLEISHVFLSKGSINSYFTQLGKFSEKCQLLRRQLALYRKISNNNLGMPSTADSQYCEIPVLKLYLILFLFNLQPSLSLFDSNGLLMQLTWLSLHQLD